MDPSANNPAGVPPTPNPPVAPTAPTPSSPPPVQPPSVFVVGPPMLEKITQDFVSRLRQSIDKTVPVKYFDTETNEGANIAETYDIEENMLPAVLIVEDDESVYKDWYGEDLPAIDQVVYEVSQLIGAEEA